MLDPDILVPSLPSPEELRATWPWTHGFARELLELRQTPFSGSHLIVGSDYSGSHVDSQFRTYGFLIADADMSPFWPMRIRRVRDGILKERRMSFKNLNDVRRREALIPFLEAAEAFTGHVVVVAVAKKLSYLTSYRQAIKRWSDLHGVKARWESRAFEEMSRVAHFFSLFVAAWSSPAMNVSWFTDEDDIVANADRLEDAHQFAAKLSNLHVRHQLGEFMMNTPAVVPDDFALEDFLAIPDLAAGMVGEILAKHNPQWSSHAPSSASSSGLSAKSDIIADWFWHNEGTLRKTCILIQAAGEGQYGIGTLKSRMSQ